VLAVVAQLHTVERLDGSQINAAEIDATVSHLMQAAKSRVQESLFLVLANGALVAHNPRAISWSEATTQAGGLRAVSVFFIAEEELS